ncbi:MAG TPA: type IV secretion system DNA-binding domain-containing protein [Xanthomonadales bacterium]|nr:type IV secretion system DNA-binding domain-containing protein [Xanthomonadales bacterium]
MEQVTSALQSTLSIIGFLIGTLIGLIISAILLRRILVKAFFTKQLERNLTRKENSFLSIKIPPGSGQKEEAMEAFLRSLHRVLPTGTYLSLEMVSSDQFLKFYIVIPKTYKAVLESQLYAQYPDAEIEEKEDYFSHWTEHTAVVSMKFKHSSINPIKTYKNLDEDLLKNISAVLSKTEKNEKAAIQLILKRVGSKSWEKGIRPLWAQHIDRGATDSPVQQKIQQDLYLGKLRIAYTAENISIAKVKLHTLINLFKSVKGQNELKKPRFFVPKNLKKAFNARVFETGDLWSIPEIVTLYHFPYKGNIVSNIVETESKRAPAPDIMPREGTSAESLSVIGETNYRNDRIRFGILQEDRRRHMYVIGKTGVGKSRFLELLMISDIKNNRGLCLIDPHGDLAEAVLKQVPKERVKDVIYVNPADRDFPIAFNPLEYTRDYEKRQHIAYFFISIFKKIFSSDWNERMEHILRYIILALLETPDSNILGIPRMLSDTKYRHRVIAQLKDPVVKAFWANEFASWNEQYSTQAIVPILNKVGQFISNPIIRNMVGQQKNALDFSEFMNKGKIVIINVSKGKLGEENAALLGSMFITKIQQAALSRANIPESERRDFYFYIDEFQNFATEAFQSILSESRKYRLNLTIAHQYIDQLSEDIKSSVFGNVASLFVFATGGDDAKYLANEFTPTFTKEDILGLEAREMYVKMSVRGRTTRPFSARTIDTPTAQFDYSHDIIGRTQEKFADNRVAVERRIDKWSSAAESVIDDRGATDDFPEPLI